MLRLLFMHSGTNATEEMDCDRWVSVHYLLWSRRAQDSQGHQKHMVRFLLEQIGTGVASSSVA